MIEFFAPVGKPEIPDYQKFIIGTSYSMDKCCHDS